MVDCDLARVVIESKDVPVAMETYHSHVLCIHRPPFTRWGALPSCEALCRSALHALAYRAGGAIGALDTEVGEVVIESPVSELGVYLFVLRADHVDGCVVDWRQLEYVGACVELDQVSLHVCLVYVRQLEGCDATCVRQTYEPSVTDVMA